MNKIVAIDGPAGSGKGTIAKRLADECNLLYIDTGAMYRAIAYKMLKNNISIEEEEKIVDLAKESKIEFIDGKTYLDGIDISREIRTMEVTKIVSPVSSIVKLREILVNLQRKMAEGSSVIMEGRDITTVVFPNANYKIYLDAAVEERAKRRYKQNIERGLNTPYEEVYSELIKRHKLQTEREVSPLIQEEDAIYLDSSNLNIEEVTEETIRIIKEQLNKKGKNI